MASFFQWLVKDDWFFVSPLDWMIILIPVAFVLFMGWYSRRYVVQVSDFLSAGRLCGRYLISVADIANGLSIIGLVAYVEVHYRTGFALTFWQNLTMPLGVVLSLTGFVTYRFRETKAMSFGQYIEMRYSRKLRIFASALRSTSEVLANMIMPAVAGRFFIYYFGLPQYFTICGIEFPTFNALIILCLTMAIGIICMGGTLALVITDSIQGMFCYPIMAIFVGFMLYKFSWNDQIVPVLTDRVANQSFLDPYDISELRDFNLFFVGVTLITTVVNRGAWTGAGNSTSAKSPHEQKMASLLGTYRGSLTSIFYILIAVALIAYFNHKDFAKQAKEVRDTISERVADGLFHAEKHQELRKKVVDAMHQKAPIIHTVGVEKPLSEEANLDTVYLAEVKSAIDNNTLDTPEVNAGMYQQFRTLYHQMMTAVGMRHMLPPGLSGLFCLLMIMAMISTDDTRIFSAALTITQDVVMPFIKKPLTPEQHMWVIRAVAIGVGVVFYFGSTLMSQLDYINLFVSTMTTMWVGAGAMVMLGLYTRFGTTAGAWSSLLTGCCMALGYIGMKQYWTDFYAFLNNMGWLEGFTAVIQGFSKPFEPIIVWRVNPYKCFVNAYEFNLIATLTSLVIYLVVSKLTCKEPFNLDRMLHRGKYNLDKHNQEKSAWTLKTVLGKLIGVTPEYTFWDRVVAYSIFVYSIIYRFLGTFVIIVIWNIFQKWPLEWWSGYFLVTSLLVPGAITVIVAFWFGIGSVIDMRQLFRDLKTRKINFLDNGQVEGNMSLADKAELEALDTPALSEEDEG
ncbi:MAG: sodium:panthothenate symporter [Lentisphaerae bacterium]|nr:sodium:panthothenate symporter [Lentisphaerota bacterium]